MSETHTLQSEPELTALFAPIDETRRLFHRMNAAAEALHGMGPGSAAQRGVMESILKNGPQTIPALAAMRPVTRQHIQGIVAELKAKGLVDFIDNPRHKRSHLVDLTPAGRDLVTGIFARERAVLSEIALPLTVDDLRTAVWCMRTLREALESPRFDQLAAEAIAPEPSHAPKRRPTRAKPRRGKIAAKTRKS